MHSVPRSVMVNDVLKCFAYMGATPEQLKKEKIALTDDEYLREWWSVIDMQPKPKIVTWLQDRFLRLKEDLGSQRWGSVLIS